MHATVTDVSDVSPSVSLSVTRLNCVLCSRAAFAKSLRPLVTVNLCMLNGALQVFVFMMIS